jgi:methionine-gamma-lyase
MVKPCPSKTQIGNVTLYPETLMLNYGYDPLCAPAVMF